MQIREATEADIPDVVELLKISLGESLMPKSEAFWRWKHVDNPFGKSPVLLAFDNEKLIGVRAFMRWEWVIGDKTIKTVRAVDTATHPDFQGKGIFRKLTMQLVEQCQQEGIHFIFNSPNKISKPGYLKMGWESLGPMRLYVKPLLNRNGKGIKLLPPLKVEDQFSFDFQSTSKTIITNPTSTFLRWRYASNPNIKYYSFQDEPINPNYLTIFRLKPFRFGIEFRICGEFNGKSFDRIKYNNQLMDVVKQSGANLITSTAALTGFFSIGMNRGPEITIRKLTSIPISLTFRNWSPTLGDMEVF